MTDTTPSPNRRRRRASSGRLRGLAHIVDVRPGSTHLEPRALCGFRPRHYWMTFDAPEWEDTCERCEAKAAGS